MGFLETSENTSSASNMAYSNEGMEEPLLSHLQKNWELVISSAVMHIGFQRTHSLHPVYAVIDSSVSNSHKTRNLGSEIKV